MKMRTKLLVIAAALLLASAGTTFAQDQAAQSDTAFNQNIWANIGFSTSSVTGDRARFDRFSDLRQNGLALDVFGEKTTPDLRVEFGGRHVGYDDQKLFASMNAGGKVKASVSFTGQPLNYGFKDDGYVRTPYDGDYKLDYATRAAVQAGTAVAVPGSPNQRTSFLGFYHPIDLKSLRDTIDGQFVFSPTEQVDLSFHVKTFTRQGTQPWGASYGFSQAVEIAAPVDNRTSDVEGKLEWGNQHGAVNVGFAHSQFDNHIQELVWDSPYRVTDTTASNAYTTGNGTSQGRLSLPPSNTEDTVSGTAVGRLAHRTTVAANFAVATLKQNGTIIPFTINMAIPTIHMDRTTAEAKVNVATFNLRLNSRPAANVWLNARYRYFNHDNKTPAFNGEEYVRLDQVMEETGGESEGHNIKQNQFAVGMAYTAMPHASFKVDYGRNAIERTLREYATTTENSIKFSVDSVGSALVTLRSSYEYAKRTGSGFDEAILTDAGQQPDMRHYDVANRDRNRGTLTFTLTPNEKTDVTLSVAAGKDTYPDQEFGLLNNKNQTYTVGFDVFPNDMVTFGVIYGYEKYTSLSASRAANPGATFVDPSYNWDDNADEKVNTFSANLDLIKAIQKTDIRFGYDYSKSDANFMYSGPQIDRLTAAGQFDQLPVNANEFNHATVDVRYYISSRTAVSLAYWFDKYNVSDFATPEPAPGESQPRVDPQGALLLGYYARPYTAHTGFFRVLLFF
jgi:MtrB/PioB family decaheme-associated outer membrane protein